MPRARVVSALRRHTSQPVGRRDLPRVRSRGQNGPINTALKPTTGAELLSQLGFLHVPGSPLVAGHAYLFVAIRRRPTLRHFDPQRAEFWLTQQQRGKRQSIDWWTRDTEMDYAWGGIRIADRLGVSNDYVSFGGQLSVERVNDVKVAVFRSAAPILAAGGHSQDCDPLAHVVAGFLARLRAVAGRGLKQEAVLASLSPVALYSAFVADCLRRYDDADRLSSWRPRTVSLLQAEARRLREQSPDEWSAGFTASSATDGLPTTERPHRATPCRPATSVIGRPSRRGTRASPAS